MALKLLILRSKLETAKKSLEELRAKDGDFATREAELEQAIDELTEEVAEADRQELEKQVDDFQKEKDGHEEAKTSLENEIKNIEEQMAEEEKRSAKVIKKPKNEITERGIGNMNNTRTKFFGMNTQERDAFFAREDVKDFLQRTRTLASQTRAVSGADLLIPTVVLELIKENVLKSSKLYKHVNVKAISGDARQNIMGTVPEGVWTEMCATLNELNLTFSTVEVDGYKVGGYIAVCNAVLEDSDMALATEIISALGQAIGFALDKAILYGTGTKMPTGIVTRLLQTTEPAGYSAKARKWENLSASNVLSISGKTDAQLFKALVTATSAAKGVYSRGAKFWAMNETTHANLVANSLSINAAGAITAGVNGTMPVIGGAIEELNFIPDNVIIGGYGDLYLLVERAGTKISQSEHVNFVQDQTVFKGTARYDGVPAIPEGFVAIDIAGGTVSASVISFAEDKANTSTEG